MLSLRKEDGMDPRTLTNVMSLFELEQTDLEVKKLLLFVAQNYGLDDAEPLTKHWSDVIIFLLDLRRELGDVEFLRVVKDEAFQKRYTFVKLEEYPENSHWCIVLEHETMSKVKIMGPFSFPDDAFSYAKFLQEEFRLFQKWKGWKIAQVVPMEAAH